MIDRNLNYGRHHIHSFLTRSLPFQTVLDLGAGSGTDLLLASEVNPGSQRLAVEVYPPYVEKLQGIASRVFSINIECEPLPFSERQVDVVIANQVLEHMKEIFWIFHEVSRVLPVNGKFIIGVPNLAALHNRILLSLGRQPSPIKTASAHIRGFTRPDLLGFAEACFPGGYHLKAWGGSNFYPFPPSIAKILAGLFPSFAWGIFLLLEKKKEYRGEFLNYPVAEQLETNFFLGT